MPPCLNGWVQMPCEEGVLVRHVDVQRSCEPTHVAGAVYLRLVVSDDEHNRFALVPKNFLQRCCTASKMLFVIPDSAQFTFVCEGSDTVIPNSKVGNSTLETPVSPVLSPLCDWLSLWATLLACFGVDWTLELGGERRSCIGVESKSLFRLL